MALHHKNTPDIVSTTRDFALENVALTHAPVRSAEGHTLEAMYSGKAQTPSLPNSECRKNNKQPLTTSLLMESSITTPIGLLVKGL